MPDQPDWFTQVLLNLPERVEKLERVVFEQRLLLGSLLTRQGLDQQGLERAFAWATEASERVLQELAERKHAEWLQTPEGEEASRKANKEFLQRQRELWREWCREDGKIRPDPTAT